MRIGNIAIFAVIFSLAAGSIGVIALMWPNSKLDIKTCYEKLIKMDDPEKYYDNCDALAAKSINSDNQNNSARSFNLRVGGLYNILVRDNESRAILFLDKAISLGNEEAKIDQVAMLVNDDKNPNCTKIKHLLLSFRPHDHKDEDRLRGWKATYNFIGCGNL